MYRLRGDTTAIIYDLAGVPDHRFPCDHSPKRLRGGEQNLVLFCTRRNAKKVKNLAPRNQPQEEKPRGQQADDGHEVISCFTYRQEDMRQHC